ncbi:DUF6571 family protein [Streptomyces sp. CAI-85]|uniref:DUF6571 family protein n=1 Tax=Streptomyces sp. CAI-85 TaxID=1472662 RepID=UPI0015877886|nr:DUF6571 family protein [Streptomyces sp. CAI-85]NUV63723.1 hypothetical protein [Streptomyces sp. CAI-85]
MDLDALRTADFSLLDDAVEDWSTTVGDLETLMDAAEKGLRGAANAANWAGYNATVSKEFIGKTSGEFADAHSQASSIHKILRDTRDELRKYKGQLDDAIERGRQQHLTVIGYEGGFTVTTDVPPEGRAKQDQDKKGEITALRDDIQKILDQATESDSSAGKVLNAIADQSKLGFSDVDYADRDEAADALKKADELADLAGQNPEDLSVAEFDRLNRGLKEYADDPLFAERFATRLGPRGTLDFWSGLNDPYGASRIGGERLDQYDDLQKHLSLTLATASQSDNADMTRWKSTMIDLVDQPVGPNGRFPLGGQVMSNLMRWGDYDDRFLVDYGKKLIDTEKNLTHNGQFGAWQRTGTDSYLNRTGSDSGRDPMTGYLKALSNSPDAATDFFNDTFVTKDEDHDFTHDTDGDGKQGKRTLSNFDYLFEERDWPRDYNDKGEDSIAGRNNLALALEAATTGHPAGELPTADTPAHNAEQAHLTKRLVESISEKPSRLTGHGYMSDSMGQIAAEYMPDIHRGLHPGAKGETELFPIAGSAATFSERDTTRFLYTLGRNPDSYAAVNLGQTSYTTQLMQYHFQHPDVYAPDPAFGQEESLRQGIGDIARTAGQIEGMIGAGRAYESELEGGVKDADYNATLESVGTWGGTAVGIGVGMATTPLTGPGGVIVGGLAGTAADEIISAITEGSLRDSSDDVVYRNGEEIEGTRSSTYAAVEAAAQKAGRNSGHSYPLIEASVGSSAESGFDSARTKIHDYLDGEGVPRQLDTEG